MLARITLITTATCILLLMLLALPVAADEPIAQRPTQPVRPTVQPPTPRPSVWPPPRPTSTATPTVYPPEPPPVIPEAPTWILLGSAATGLAGYVGLQLWARRRK